MMLLPQLLALAAAAQWPPPWSDLSPDCSRGDMAADAVEGRSEGLCDGYRILCDPSPMSCDAGAEAGLCASSAGQPAGQEGYEFSDMCPVTCGLCPSDSGGGGGDGPPEGEEDEYYEEGGGDEGDEHEGPGVPGCIESQLHGQPETPAVFCSLDTSRCDEAGLLVIAERLAEANCPPPPGESLTQPRTIRSSISFSIDIAEVSPGSAARQRFEQEFKRQVAARLNLVCSCSVYRADAVVIESIAAGSARVDFGVIASDGDGAVAAAIISHLMDMRGSGAPLTVAGSEADLSAMAYPTVTAPGTRMLPTTRGESGHCCANRPSDASIQCLESVGEHSNCQLTQVVGRDETAFLLGGRIEGAICAGGQFDPRTITTTFDGALATTRATNCVADAANHRGDKADRAMVIQDGASVFVHDSIFERSAYVHRQAWWEGWAGGGAMLVKAASVDVTATHFIGNEVMFEGGSWPVNSTDFVVGGGALLILSGERETTANIRSSLFAENTAFESYGGGAIAIFTGHSKSSSVAPKAVFLSITGCRFEDNRVLVGNRAGLYGEGGTLNGGGAIMIRDIYALQEAEHLVTVTIESSTFVNNTIGEGNGGAIQMLFGQLDVIGTVFEDNLLKGWKKTNHTYLAEKGAPISTFAKDIFAVSSVRFHIYETTFEPFSAESISVDRLAGCDKYPCEYGQQCVYKKYSLQCLPCPGALVGLDRRTCTECRAGEGPNTDHTQCVCKPGTYNSSITNTTRRLIYCFEQDFYADRLEHDDMTTTRVLHTQSPPQDCLPCPDECLQCDGNGAEPAIKNMYSLSPQGRETWSSSLSSVQRGAETLPVSLFRCPIDGQVCENVTGRAGNHTDLMKCTRGHTGVLCGQCMTGWTGGFNKICTACPEAAAFSVVVAVIAFVVTAFVLYWCFSSAEKKMKPRLDSVRIKIAIARRAHKAAKRISCEVDSHGDKVELDEDGAFQHLLQIIKIVVSNLQIIAQFPTVLKFNCPACSSIKAQMRTIFAVNLDVLQLASFDCMIGIDLFGRFFFIVTAPIVIVLLIQLRARTCSAPLRCGSKVSVSQAHRPPAVAGEVQVESEAPFVSVLEPKPGPDRVQAANNISMLVVFLTYPAVSSTIFTMFSCRELDMRQSYHVYDTSIDCNGSTYLSVYVVAFILLILLPVGIPIAYAVLLYKNRALFLVRDAEEQEISFPVFVKTVRNVFPGAHVPNFVLVSLYKSIDRDDSDSISVKELVRHGLRETLGRRQATLNAQASGSDEIRAAGTALVQEEPQRREWWQRTAEEFEFLCKSFEPEYYYFELVIFAKKFLLSGALVFVSPGSSTQLYVALVISFFFFALLCRSMPYKKAKTDRVAVVAEANLFFTILCLLMLKLNLAGEFFTTDFYDKALVASNGLASIAPLTIGILISLKQLAIEWLESSNQPSVEGDSVRILECPEDPRCRLQIGKVLQAGSHDSKTLSVEVVLASKCERCRSKCTAGRARNENDTASSSVTVHVSPDQVLKVVGRKATLRLCSGIFKQAVSCARALCCKNREEPEAESSEQDVESGHHLHLKDAVEDVDTEIDVEHALDLRTLKKAALKVGRPLLEPLLQRRGLDWAAAEKAVSKITSVNDLQNATEDPETFITFVLGLCVKAASTLALARLRPALEPLLSKQGLTWEAALPALQLLDSVEEISAAVEAPEKFLQKLMVAAGPVAIRLALSKLQPQIEPLLAKHELSWEAALPALEKAAGSVAVVEAASQDPAAFVEKVLAAAGPVAIRLALSKLQPQIEPLLAKHELSWEAALP
eukprot:SAG22_NODE_996_length_6115_cov_59.761303_1_plen_1780_part_01